MTIQLSKGVCKSILVCHCNYVSRTVSEIFIVKQWLDLEMWVRDHWRSLKIVPFDSLGSFLFAFHSNYGSILYHFRDIAIYWSKVAILSYILHSTPPFRVVPVRVLP